jgi:primosomal protein N' (replication factor Y)
LIIVDEEHESSYKQDSPSPRYNARDTAVMRAKLCEIPVVLGSATPSLESRYNAGIGRYKLLEITHRADSAVLPQIMIVDSIIAKKAGQMNGQFSKPLLLEIEERLTRKEGVILFQNRRGYASLLECQDCGFIPMCKNCDVSLTYHKNKHQLRCHYCGYSIDSFKACPTCGHPEISELGSGTQRIEDDLFDILTADGFSPVIQRVDLDSTMRKGSLRRIFHAFANGEIDILVGTQMVAKGLDFERVTLVGVINADMQLFLPDFRAVERTFQLLTQVSGRSGRSGSKPGEVVIQTAHPKNPAIAATLSNSYKMFYENEIYNRKKLGYPPFSRFIHVEFSGKNEKKVEDISLLYFNLIPNHDSIIKMGPSIPLISKLKNNYRRYIIIKNNKEKDVSGKTLRNVIKYVQGQYDSKYSTASVRVTINVDSFNSL